MAKHPTYGYRRITAILNRQLLSEGLALLNHKRVYHIMKRYNLLLQQSGFDRPERNHDGKVMMMLSNLLASGLEPMASSLAQCSDGMEFAGWNGDGRTSSKVRFRLARDIRRAFHESPMSTRSPKIGFLRHNKGLQATRGSIGGRSCSFR